MRYRALPLVLMLIAGCGKDASIRLTRPEVEAPKTKRVHFSLTTPERAQVSAILSSPSQTIEMSSAGQRSFDATIGENLQVNVSVPEGFEVRDWNVVPGGNTDFNNGSASLTIKNIQEDIRVSAVVQRIPPRLARTETVYFSIVTADQGEIIASFGEGEDAKKETFSGAGQRVLEIPTGENFHAALKLPRAWEVEKWEVSEGGDTNLDKKPELLVTNVKESLKIVAHVRKIPMLNFQVRINGTSHLFNSRGSGDVKWAVFKPGEKVPDEWSIFSTEGHESSIADTPRVSAPKSYPNGSKISVKFSFIDGTGKTWYVTDLITLDDHTVMDFDFRKVTERAYIQGQNVYEYVGGAPRKGGSFE